ncbi:TetR/AcrR family transcriptional regulator [Nocardiopsis sp. B62]|uniref:TetR/AcrR family transcriptional regulator n=1 Tax=Nocardiopsis sp. B62 TaxID=2824874 RepID=UPI001B37ACC0|nr:TetR/AcrR family transcriptional regulator [Nocardiopsis sp. B62]MBQ1081975.1 TetR/AcrR family transcriptional regulator [Nocardiopsis sp. B62]
MDGPPEPIPRVPRAQVRSRLLAAAARVFAEHGYAESRLEDVARAAGFTKGAVYSNFGGKQDLFAAVLSDRSEHEFTTAAALERSAAAEEALVGIARRVTEDTQRGRLGLEFAAHATRHGPTAVAVTRMRRSQRETLTELVTELTERHGVRLTAPAETVALALHCLTIGLSMEHLADPETVDARAVEDTLITTLAGFAARAEHEETP